jgi:outer membrane protein OmpA-like peptidoglycan-associated protein
MSSRYFAASLLCLGTVFGGPALAEPAYDREEIVKFFIQSADLGAARGICIGTAQECAANAPKPAGFDMLINFELDSAELTEEARENLKIFAEALKDERLSAASFVVEGHTDAYGPEDYNLELSRRRAEAVATYLMELGVSPERLEAIGLGETRQRTANPYDGENRRVEMRIRLQ